jgi:hypothetical protein
MSTRTAHIFSLILSLIFFGYGCASPPAQIPTHTTTLGPASTPNPYSDDDVLISFIIDASDGMDEMSACLAADDTYRFLLYRNGHLIRFDGVQYLETRISQVEIDELLSEIDATGFPSLIGDGDQYIQNAPPPSFVNTWGASITVDEKTITITPGQSDYLVEPVKKTLDIVGNYRPKNLQVYTPESISLWVFLEENIRLGLANPTPEPPVLNWSDDDINLDNLLTDLATSKPQVLSGDPLSFLIGQIKHVPALRWVEQNRQKYLVVLCPHFRG